MAFDQSTRNRLQKLVSDCRRLLSDEFSIQLQQTYGIDPNSGEVASLERLTHLSDRDRQTAQLLRDTLAHYLAVDEDDKVHRIAAIDRIIREQAFTVLNRLAALLMMEARGLLVAAVVSQGQQSQAFELYKMVAGSALGETGEAYRTFLFSLFDEFAIDLPALFDRHTAQGRLFPREPTLLVVLEALNHHEIQPLWAEDETIGWIYQYFNSKEERKAMREASQAPRNSRELAVRNQFFTPRYVVEFLVDNTLGRLWFNATGGQTELRERCQYLLAKPDEQPQASVRLRDPRTLKLLDPACGSMHFGLYAFDLFLQIYQEAWDWEQAHGPGSLDVTTQPNPSFRPLCQSYPDREAYLRDAPRLIVEHNIYGVDIDPRAAQIASLALWLRAQRAWHAAGVKAQQRPDVGLGHVVAAMAPPAERELRQQFAANLDKRDAELFEKTLQLLKGLPELGVLLQVERELPNLIRQVYVGTGTGLFAAEEHESWEQAEARLRMALVEFAQAAKSTYQGQLFAQDALEGLRLIDLCREVFDVVVMNPPFGEVGALASKYCDNNYKSWNKNILCAFSKRAKEISRNGYVGCVIDRSLVNKSTYDKFRDDVFLGDESLEIILDLGWGVLDGANVEVSSFVLHTGNVRNPKALTKFLDLRMVDLEEKEFELDALIERKDYASLDLSSFRRFPNSALAYDLPKGMLEVFRDNSSILDQGFCAYTGHQLQSDRHFYLHWEIPRDGLTQKKFEYLYNGGEYSRYVSSPKEVCLFGYFSCLNGSDVGGYTFVLRNKAQHLKKGVYFGVRGEYLDAHLTGPGRIFTVEGQAMPCESFDDALFILAYLNSALASRILNTYSGQHKYSGYVNLLPLPSVSEKDKQGIASLVEKVINIKLKYYSFDESSLVFRKPFWMYFEDSSFLVEKIQQAIDFDQESIEILHREIDEILISIFCLSGSDAEYDIREYSENLQSDKSLLKELTSGFALMDYVKNDLLLFLMGCCFGRWSPDSIDARSFDIGAKEYFESFLSDISFSEICSGKDVLGGDELCEPNQLIGPNSVLSNYLDALQISRSNMREYFSGGGLIFDYQLKKYQSGRKQAPIYWPISTVSGGYTLWLYYPCITDQTLFTAVNDFVEPKLKSVRGDLDVLHSKGTHRTRQEEIDLEALASFEHELADLRDTLLEIAPNYRPNQEDGVQITAAPLWKLFRHKPWQKVLKDTWAKLEKGDYDWAHLAMIYRPQQVREKCVTDKSLAIAHGLEHLYVEPEPTPKKTRGRKKAGSSE